MRPFGCPVTILNTLDHLGKIDGKADEGYFVGYSMNSKALKGGEKKDAKDPGNEDNGLLSTKGPRVNQEKDANVVRNKEMTSCERKTRKGQNQNKTGRKRLEKPDNAKVQLQSRKQKKRRKYRLKGPNMQILKVVFIQENSQGLKVQFIQSTIQEAESAIELTLLKSISPGIDETDCYPEEDIHFTKRLLYDNSSPRPPEKFVSENSNTEIESFSPSHIPIEDSDTFMEEIDLSFNPDDPMPPGIEDDADDSERDIPILKDLPSNYSLSLPENESFLWGRMGEAKRPKTSGLWEAPHAYL
nr:ribonuclease H-like domain-containing protein [Tanacetum cinerariifolium]